MNTEPKYTAGEVMALAAKGRMVAAIYADMATAGFDSGNQSAAARCLELSQHYARRAAEFSEYASKMQAAPNGQKLIDASIAQIEREATQLRASLKLQANTGVASFVAGARASHQVATPDKKPHPSVQAWSRGPLFPAVIARIDYHTDTGMHLYTNYELLYPGLKPQRYTTYDDAAQQARGLNRAAEMREAAQADVYEANDGAYEHSAHYHDIDRNGRKA